LNYGTQQFEGPWAISAFTVDSATKALWVSFVHHTWWPSFVMRFDSSGKGRVVFTHPGWILSLMPINGVGRSLILAGGINNEYASPALAVLSQEDWDVSPPAGDDPKFVCSGRAKPPLRYVIFPNSELNRLIGERYNRGSAFRVQTNEILYWVSEIKSAGVYYSLSRSANPMPQSFQFQNSYWLTHRRLSFDGKIDHSSDECHEQRSRSVRMWTPQTGWDTLALPPTF
jgi:hypothetical protein